MRCLRRAGLTPDRLELEVTESVFVDPSKDLIVGVLRRLAEIGITLAIDDFGTGYSSLAYLKYFPFHKIKIDGSFVRDVGRESEGKAIVSAVVALGQSLGQARGGRGRGRREGQLAFLRERGCDLAQGFLLGRPASGAGHPGTLGPGAGQAAGRPRQRRLGPGGSPPAAGDGLQSRWDDIMSHLERGGP